ncbi:MAG: tetratricopeptide repeat protein [Acidobacteria bacterium]|uniref:Tetratricopeptide repeat protein n=1 Tax=Candidatus Polarisedimenticola svalbardensis TaxID=2886004 RepID=A0A8J6Y2I6_9BACT|nr:tetratricopeptide repeat protein [Candidatus Polarisedimenticola svalbardensis]
MNRIPLRLVLSAAIVLALGSTGCVLPDHIGSLQKDISDVRSRIDQIETDQQASIQRLEALVREMDEGEDAPTRADFADLKLEIQDSTRKLAILEEQFRDTNGRLDGQSRDLQEALALLRNNPGQAPHALEGGAGPQESETREDNAFMAAGGQAVPDAEGLYNAAYADYSKGNYPLAVSGFNEYAERYAGSDLADNALYWVGECHYSEGAFDRAIGAFDNLLEKFPETDRAASANLKKGLAYLEMNDIRKAVVQLKYVLENFGDTDEARMARDTLASLGVPAR